MALAAGTRILTPDGVVPIESIKVGDQVIAVRDGAEDVLRVTWAGRRGVDPGRHPRPERVLPVRILNGAFGPGLPERDLLVSPDHGVFLDGHLIEARALVNGATVIRETAARQVIYHHIALAHHDVLLAESLALETLPAGTNRAVFAQTGGAMVLHPEFGPSTQGLDCARRVSEGKVVRAARRGLLDRALTLGFERTDAVDLVAKIGLEKISPQPGDRPGELLFALPAGARRVTLLCGAAVPAEISAQNPDRRQLGAAIRELALLTAGDRRVLALDGPHEGFHQMETGLRWTNGAARIDLPGHAGPAVLAVLLQAQMTRWKQAPAGRDFMTL